MEPQNQKFVFCPKIIELSYLVKAIFGQIPNVTQCENFDFTDFGPVFFVSYEV